MMLSGRGPCGLLLDIQQHLLRTAFEAALLNASCVICGCRCFESEAWCAYSTCRASSLVGARMSALSLEGPPPAAESSLFSMSRCKMGNPNASVLPDPCTQSQMFSKGEEAAVGYCRLYAASCCDAEEPLQRADLLSIMAETYGLGCTNDITPVSDSREQALLLDGSWLSKPCL